jgi:hypothetical protein
VLFLDCTSREPRPIKAGAFVRNEIEDRKMNRLLVEPADNPDVDFGEIVTDAEVRKAVKRRLITHSDQPSKFIVRGDEGMNLVELAGGFKVVDANGKTIKRG